MSVYDIIERYGLARRGQIDESQISRVTDKELSRFYEEYARICEHREAVGEETDRRVFRVYPDSADPGLPLSAVRRLCLYAHRIFLDDPLYGLAVRWLRPGADLFAVTKGQEARLEREQQAIRGALGRLLEIRPLVESGIVVPLGRQRARTLSWFVPKPGSVPLFEQSPSAPPPSLIAYGVESLLVQPVRYVDSDFVVTDGPLTPGRMIACGFRGDPTEPRRLFFLHEILPIRDEDEEHRILHTSLNLRDPQPVTEEEFETWVNQSAAAVLRDRFEGVVQDVRAACASGARLLTGSPVSRDMLEIGLSAEMPMEPVSSALLRIDLPVLDKVSIADLAKVRRDEDAFERFREALDRAFAEIASDGGTATLEQRIKTVQRDILGDAVDRVSRANKQLKSRVFLNAGVIATSLVAAYPTGGLTLAAALVAALQGIYDLRDHQAAIRDEPAFFFWKLITRAER